MTVTVIRTREILSALSAGYPRNRNADGKEEAFLAEAADVFQNEVEATGLAVQGGYEELRLLLPTYLKALTEQRHCAAVIEVGSGLPVDSLYKLDEFRRFAEFAAVTRSRGNTMRVLLAFYTKEAGGKYDDDLFPRLLAGAHTGRNRED